MGNTTNFLAVALAIIWAISCFVFGFSGVIHLLLVLALVLVLIKVIYTTREV